MGDVSTMSSRMVNPFERVDVHDHICLAYQTRVDQFNAIVPFLNAGLQHGEKCIFLGAENTARALSDAMHQEGIDSKSAIRGGALAIARTQDIYFKKSGIRTTRMMLFLNEAINLAKADGFPSVRATFEMNWVFGTYPTVTKIMEFEANLSRFVSENDVTLMCQYKINYFGPVLTIDAINTHPLVVSNELVCKNFYYIPPRDFLEFDQTHLEVKKTLDNILHDNMLAVAHNNTNLKPRIKNGQT